MKKLFLRTGHKRDMFFACQKISGAASPMNIKQDGYCIDRLFFDMEEALEYIEERNTAHKENGGTA